MVAGDPEREIRARRLVEGIPIPGKLVEQLRAIAEAGGTKFLLDTQP
jgi:LDH2 family malate/lactate/ureidoglycolate dehydrogenase